MVLPRPKGGNFLVFLCGIMLSGNSRITKQLYFVDYIINYLKKRRVGCEKYHMWVSIFEASNLFLIRLFFLSS